MLFNIKSASGKLKESTVKINRLVDLLHLINVHEADIIINQTVKNKEYTITVYDDYIE